MNEHTAKVVETAIKETTFAGVMTVWALVFYNMWRHGKIRKKST